MSKLKRPGLWCKVFGGALSNPEFTEAFYNHLQKGDKITAEDERYIMDKAQRTNPLYYDRKKWEKEAEKSNQKILNKPVSKWSEQDRADIMRSKLYGTDEKTKRKVKEYYEHHNKGYQKYDATGRPY